MLSGISVKNQANDLDDEYYDVNHDLRPEWEQPKSLTQPSAWFCPGTDPAEKPTEQIESPASSFGKDQNKENGEKKKKSIFSTKTKAKMVGGGVAGVGIFIAGAAVAAAAVPVLAVGAVGTAVYGGVKVKKAVGGKKKDTSSSSSPDWAAPSTNPNKVTGFRKFRKDFASATGLHHTFSSKN